MIAYKPLGPPAASISSSGLPRNTATHCNREYALLTSHIGDPMGASSRIFFRQVHRHSLSTSLAVVRSYHSHIPIHSVLSFPMGNHSFAHI